MDDFNREKLLNDPKFIELLLYVHTTTNETGKITRLTEIKLKKRLLSALQEFSAQAFSGDLGQKYHGTLARNIRYRYSRTPLSTEGNTFTDGRFHRKGISHSTLYLAQSEHIAVSERKISGNLPVPPHLNFWVEVSLQNILNLTSTCLENFSSLNKQKSILSLPYEYFNNFYGTDSFSQILAKMCRNEGYEGILYKSVRGEGICLAIFVDNMLVGSRLAVVHKEDFSSALEHHLAIDGSI
jgi:hypothetical protein